MIYYCPKCNKLDTNYKYTEDTRKFKTVSNMRDGWGRPITHYLCECGNPLAGIMSFDADNQDTIDYVKDLIIQYNEGGIFFESSLLKAANDILEFKRGKHIIK